VEVYHWRYEILWGRLAVAAVVPGREMGGCCRERSAGEGRHRVLKWRESALKGEGRGFLCAKNYFAKRAAIMKMGLRVMTRWPSIGR